MEPSVATIVLHPAILIASGFESISSQQVRFLHAYRLHFHEHAQDLTETLVLTKRDFDLGGILNPFGKFFDSEDAYIKFGKTISNFPYLTRREIIGYVYKYELTKIWAELLSELYGDLSQYCVTHKRTRDYFQATTKVIHDLSQYPIFNKISALHSCGLGGKLADAFEFIFSHFKDYERMADEPFVVKK